jgi:hypothetical protein
MSEMQFIKIFLIVNNSEILIIKKKINVGESKELNTLIMKITINKNKIHTK